MKKNTSNNLRINVLKRSAFIIPLAGLLNYFLISRSIEAGYFSNVLSTVILTVLFPSACVWAGIMVGIGLTESELKTKKRNTI